MRARLRARPNFFGGMAVLRGMKKAKAGNSGKQRKKTSAKGKKNQKPVDLPALRQLITNMVGNEAEGMVASTINEADKGHYPAMKYLFEMVGLYPEGGQAEAPQGEDALAKTLLRRLDLPEEPGPQATVTNETAEPRGEGEGDHVK